MKGFIKLESSGYKQINYHKQYYTLAAHIRLVGMLM